MNAISLKPRYYGKGRADNPDPVDVHVGAKIRQLRVKAGTSQERLATALGIKFQQLQKYERGMNRVSASRLYQLAQIFDVPVGSFFKGFKEEAGRRKSVSAGRFDWLEATGGDLMERQETQDLVRVFYMIKAASVRDNFIKLLKTLIAA